MVLYTKDQVLGIEQEIFLRLSSKRRSLQVLTRLYSYCCIPITTWYSVSRRSPCVVVKQRPTQRGRSCFYVLVSTPTNQTDREPSSRCGSPIVRYCCPPRTACTLYRPLLLLVGVGYLSGGGGAWLCVDVMESTRSANCDRMMAFVLPSQAPSPPPPSRHHRHKPRAGRKYVLRAAPSIKHALG